MVPTILQNKDACYCEFYRAVNFVVRDAATIRRSPSDWGHKKPALGSSCSHH